jgi:hypothetical protein
MRDQYFRQLEALLPKVIKKLKAKGIKRQHLAFGGEGAVRKPRVPTDAPSEFLANRAMGDWAEQRLATALPAALPEWTVVQYGDTSRITAGAPPFKAHYLAEIEKTRQFGKRPDLLLIPTALVTGRQPVPAIWFRVSKSPRPSEDPSLLSQTPPNLVRNRARENFGLLGLSSSESS